MADVRGASAVQRSQLDEMSRFGSHLLACGGHKDLSPLAYAPCADDKKLGVDPFLSSPALSAWGGARFMVKLGIEDGLQDHQLFAANLSRASGYFKAEQSRLFALGQQATDVLRPHFSMNHVGGAGFTVGAFGFWTRSQFQARSPNLFVDIEHLGDELTPRLHRYEVHHTKLAQSIDMAQDIQIRRSALCTLLEASGGVAVLDATTVGVLSMTQLNVLDVIQRLKDGMPAIWKRRYGKPRVGFRYVDGVLLADVHAPEWSLRQRVLRINAVDMPETLLSAMPGAPLGKLISISGFPSDCLVKSARMANTTLEVELQPNLLLTDKAGQQYPLCCN